MVAPSRRTTSPVTVTTLSTRNRSAAVKASVPAANTHCVRPAWSRRSTNSSPPWSRLLWTQPDSRAVPPASEARSAPQVWVR